jgi:hypothetical protein
MSRGMTHSFFFANRLGRLRQWPWLCGLLSLLLVRAALGTDAAYTNNAFVEYYEDGNPVDTIIIPSDFNPMIDAFNFVNNGTFIIDEFNSTYQTRNTTNYINNSLMEGYGGFWFDRHTTGTIPDLWATSFYNPGEIDCQYTLKVWATNIVSPGTLSVSSSTLGLMQLYGNNVDLSRSTISMSGGGQFNGQIFYFYPTVGLITNFWSPSVNLAMPYPYTPPFQVPPYGYDQLQLLNPTVYAYDTGMANSNRMVQVVYISQPNPAIANNVSFDPTPNVGGITVQFSGAYMDPATALLTTNYLVIFDNFGETTNLQVVGVAPFSFPVNYSIFESGPAILTPPPPVGLPPGIYGNVSVTNAYSFVMAQLAPTTVSTNNIANGAITNLPARVQIMAGNDLDLTLAIISGANYMSLTSTNQFQGNSGAIIVTPFADINLGVTNGYLTITNLLASAIPVWDGEIYLWSARWQYVDATGGTNSFHVLFVDSLSLSASASAQVQDLILHATNSLVISDVFNVMRTLSIDARNLTLTTNGYGNGAASPEGELNLTADSIFWASSLRFLRNLTNNGAIRTMNLTYFGSSDTPTYTTNTTPAIAATGTLSETASNGNVPAINTATIGTYTYVFVSNITNTVPNQIKIAATFDGSMSNLIAAINHAAGSGTGYSTNVTTNTFVTAGLLTNHSFTVTARTAGTNGNSIVTTTSTTNLTWGLGTLSGGVDAATNVVRAGGPYSAFVNHGLVSNQAGSTFIYADYFENSGSFANTVLGSFNLQSLNTVLTNGSIIAGGDVSITTGSLMTSNLVMQAGRSLTLQATNLLTDSFFLTNGFYPNTTNLNFWSVGGTSLVGLNLPIKPLVGDLLGTTIFMTAPPPNKQVVNTWAATNYGVSTAGYTNNVAIGHLILDALGTSSSFKFAGTGTSNAMYVDYLELRDQATNRDGSGNFTALSINNNMVIYYASAFMNGLSIADKMNHKNGDRLRWVPEYVGYFSFTNIVYPDGTTNTMNISLAQSTTLDSDGDGIANALDPTPLFVSSQLDFTLQLTNNPSPTVLIKWHSIPSATNILLFRTNLMPSFTWQVLTNFISPSLVPPAGGWPITNTVPDRATNSARFYRVRVDPNTTSEYGP